jgi:hypothetical protein
VTDDFCGKSAGDFEVLLGLPNDVPAYAGRTLVDLRDGLASQITLHTNFLAISDWKRVSSDNSKLSKCPPPERKPCHGAHEEPHG